MNGYYGFYSSEAAKVFGYSIYLNENNEEIKVTYVTKDPLVGYFQYLWSDKEFVGSVVKHIRSKKGKRDEPPGGHGLLAKWDQKLLLAQIFNEME